MLIVSRFKPLPDISYIQVGEVELTPSATATNPDFTFDEYRTSKQYIDKVTGQAFQQIGELYSIRSTGCRKY